MSRLLLLVETSATMRRVLGEHLRALGYHVEEAADHTEALQRINDRLRRFDEDYTAVVFGWPAIADADAEALAARLERDDAIELPVIVMSTDLRAETRAWVAARPHTSLLAWKKYRDIDPMVEGLTATDDQQTDKAVKFDNSDIRLLVVDDSATIRRSLSELFSQQGYQTVLAADGTTAVDLAFEQRIDIAIVDFYLGEDTGDRVCRELVTEAGTGDIVCAVLTGTYSDHIIRRSLRAGALECLFKNESSELLLNRVDALSRFVRQRRRLADERRLLDSVVDLVAGAALVLDSDDAIRHVSHEALMLLGHDKVEALLGHPLSVVAGQTELPVDAGTAERTLSRADGSNLDVVVDRRALAGAAGTVLQFKLADPSVAPTAVSSSSLAGDRITDSQGDSTLQFSPTGEVSAVPPEAMPFLSLLSRMQEGAEPIDQQASLLLMRLWVCSDDAAPESLEDHPDLEARVAPALIALYKRRDHVAALGDGRFGFLLRHVDEPQSWLLTRRLMQLANDALVEIDGTRLATTASLKRVDPQADDADESLLIALEALEYADARWHNKALLVDPRRALAVYPETLSE